VYNINEGTSERRRIMKENVIDELIVELCRGAKEILEQSGYLSPVAFLVGKNNQIIPCTVPFKNDTQKRGMYLALGASMKPLGSSRVILINDAAMKTYDKSKDWEIDVTEQPLTYPESMREDGIFLQDINMKTDRIEGYFMRYENKKDAPRFYHDLKHLNAGHDGMGGFIIECVMEGYKESDQFMEEMKRELPP